MIIESIHEPKFYKIVMNVTRTYTVIVSGRTPSEAVRTAMQLDDEFLDYEYRYETSRMAMEVREA